VDNCPGVSIVRLSGKTDVFTPVTSYAIEPPFEQLHPAVSELIHTCLCRRKRHPDGVNIVHVRESNRV
jgi:hypothetical protein